LHRAQQKLLRHELRGLRENRKDRRDQQRRNNTFRENGKEEAFSFSLRFSRPGCFLPFTSFAVVVFA
jgi:hypothetical protein